MQQMKCLVSLVTNYSQYRELHELISIIINFYNNIYIVF